METSPRRSALLMVGVAVVAFPLIAIGTDAAGHDVAVAVAIAAIAALFASYVRIGVLSMRAFGDTEPSERLLRASRTHMLIFFAAPLIVMAAHPWGTVSFVVAGCLLLCQALFLHVTIVMGLIRRGRARKAR